jgi:hypothetical protein
VVVPARLKERLLAKDGLGLGFTLSLDPLLGVVAACRRALLKGPNRAKPGTRWHEGLHRKHSRTYFGLQEWIQKEMVSTRLPALKDDFNLVQFVLGQKPAYVARLAASRACDFQRVGAGCSHREA